MKKFAHPLKIASGIVAIVGWFVATELQRRELDEAVEKALDKREEARKNQPK